MQQSNCIDYKSVQEGKPIVYLYTEVNLLSYAIPVPAYILLGLAMPSTADGRIAPLISLPLKSLLLINRRHTALPPHF